MTRRPPRLSAAAAGCTVTGREPSPCPAVGILAGLALALVGIGAGGGCGAPAARLAGSVTSGGSPAAGARIDARSGESAGQRVATGVVLPDGTYRIDYGAWPGLEPGPCRIEITHVSVPAAAAAGGEAGLVAAEALAARRRRVSFDRTLEAGTNALDFELDEGTAVVER